MEGGVALEQMCMPGNPDQYPGREMAKRQHEKKIDYFFMNVSFQVTM